MTFTRKVFDEHSGEYVVETFDSHGNRIRGLSNKVRKECEERKSQYEEEQRKAKDDSYGWW